jgi:hypothetical protein
MGTLIAKAYPTKLAIGFADHTYVECGTGGKAWGCWGGKTGGRVINQGTGSTRRADAIAEPNERAGITCYMVNGVCHQAANRILLPANILVTAAKGYSLSLSIFGTYGKVIGGLGCSAPFNQQPGVRGDLLECASGGAASTSRSASKASETARRHIGALKRLYVKRGATAQTALDELNASLSAFLLEVKFSLPTARPKDILGLRQAKSKADLEHRRICENLSKKEIEPVAFVKAFNDMTDLFQDEAANALPATQYRQFFSTERGEHIYLPDPQILDEQFGGGTALAVYGSRLRQ